jgi:branched-chain amino acid transport system substrate-binding protein
LSGGHVRYKVHIALLLSVLLFAAACGDDDSTDAGSTTTEPTGTTDGGSDPTDAPAFTLDEPVKFVLLAETKGESSFAIPNFADAVQLAVDEINEAGGIGGQEIDYERVAASPTDVALAKTSLREGIDKDPTVMFGLPAANVAKPLAGDIKTAGIPFFFLFSDPSLYVGGPESVNNEMAFVMRPSNATVAVDVANWATKEKGYKRVALLCVDGPTGQVGCDTASATIEANGAEVVARERHGPADTDTTAQVQAIGAADPDVVLTFPFPNVLGVFANQMSGNGFDVPIMGGVAQGMMVDAGVVKDETATLLTGFDDCVPAADDRPEVQAFVEKFTEKYGYRPNWAAAEAYDAIYIAKAAIERAESTEPDAVAAAIKETDHEGMCDPAYRADAGNALNHNQDIVTWDADGVPTLVKRNVLPDQKGA